MTDAFDSGDELAEVFAELQQQIEEQVVTLEDSVQNQKADLPWPWRSDRRVLATVKTIESQQKTLLSAFAEMANGVARAKAALSGSGE